MRKPISLFKRNEKDVNRDKFDFKETFGGIPSSVKMFTKSKELMMYLEENSKVEDQPGQKAKASLSGTKLRYSIYIPDQAKWIMDYYIQEKGSLILDPFMGRGTRSQMALYLGHKYIGYDTCEYTIKLNKRLSEQNGFSPKNYKYVLGSGTELKEYKDKENYFDAVLSCPPYYDAEKYTGENGDISVVSFQKFDEEIDKMFKYLYRLIKPSNYQEERFYPVIFTIGSKRIGDKGLLDMDFTFQKSAKKAGFILHDKLITQNKTPIGAFTFRRNYKKRFLQKAHETTLVFLKYNI